MLDYKKVHPQKRFPDLNQLVRTGRARGECVDGCLQTLTTNTSIWSQESFRVAGFQGP